MGKFYTSWRTRVKSSHIGRHDYCGTTKRNFMLTKLVSRDHC